MRSSRHHLAELCSYKLFLAIGQLCLLAMAAIAFQASTEGNGKNGEAQKRDAQQLPSSNSGKNRKANGTSITRIGQGLVSCLQIQELQQLGTRLTSICLHGNNIIRIEGLEKHTALRELNLSSNAITAVEGLHTLGSLTSLNLASNRLTGTLSSLAGLTSLTHLNLSYNSLTNLAGLADLQGPNSKLKVLNVKHNMIASLSQLAVLAGFVNLRDLSVAGNPISQLPNYQQAILSVLPYITQLDNLTGQDIHSTAFDAIAAQNVAAAKFQSFQPLQMQLMDTLPVPLSQHDVSNVSPVQTARLQGKHTPHIDSVLQQRPPRGTAANDAGHHARHLKPQPENANCYPTQQQNVPHTVRQDVEDRDQRQVNQDHKSMQIKVFLKDAAVQATDMSTNKLNRALQAEIEQLKAQLIMLTDELDARNQNEEALRQEMADAVAAMGEEAHRRVEEGYREASQAVHKALSELETARWAASSAAQKAENLARREEELQSKVTCLEKEIQKLKQDVAQASQASKNEVALSIQAFETERQHWHETEQQLQVKLKQAQDESQAARTAATATEQRIMSLEAALQHSNSVAMSMTTQITQAMADSSTQLDALRSKLATAEASLAEATRREAELKAEVSMLTNNITSMQQRHSQELETAKQRAAEEARISIAKEVAVADERARSNAVIAAQAERAPLQEQLAFLKAQLQYVLKESERETVGLQEQLTISQQQINELQAALSNSAAKQREHESLVTDLTSVVSQQKTHIQALQKERDQLAAQLRAAGPEQIQRLAAEAASLRAAAGDAAVMREQAEHSRKQWQEAEKRLAEAQAAGIRSTEQLTQRINGLESQLASARQEARNAASQIAETVAKLTKAEDALKVKTAMIDSAHDTIASLKAELQELGMELDDARRAVEESEIAAARQAEADAQEKANLRSEIEAGEAALEAASSTVAGAEGKISAAESRAKEAETRAKLLEKQLADKDELIKYVEEEVERVKGLYEKREARLREERDTARAAAVAATSQQEVTESKLSEHIARCSAMAAELQAEREACRAATEACSRAQAEATQLSARLTDTENELRTLLAAVERQKASSAVKMRQLASLLQDMG